ncbi:MAG: glycosyltransferase, partial [Leptospiraceae bacterium]|nr:glycosyltransferase [Leptospiraceae bacterium]
MTNSKCPLLSVCFITYNHEKFIRQSLDSVLNQQTNFQFEVVIGEDCSTDKTKEIALEYKEKFPDIIRVLTSDTNIGPQRNVARTLKACLGKYVAGLEGDDYWTDPLKLQKQIDFLEQNPDHVLSFHDVLMVYDNGNQKLSSNKRQDSISTKDIIRYGRPCHTCSIVFRKPNNIAEDMAGYQSFLSGDIALMLYLSLQGKFGKVDGVMGVYRLHSEGISRTQQFMNNWRDSYVALLEYFDDLTKKQFSSDVTFKITEIRQSQINSAETLKGITLFASKLSKKSFKGFISSLGIILMALLKLLYNKLKLFWLKKKFYSIKRKIEKFYWKIRAKWNTSTVDIGSIPTIVYEAVVSPYTGLVMDQKRKVFPASAFSANKIPVLLALTPTHSSFEGVFD